MPHLGHQFNYKHSIKHGTQGMNARFFVLVVLLVLVHRYLESLNMQIAKGIDVLL